MSTYIINKNNHYANGLHFGVHFGITSQKYKVRFSKECLYQPLDWENDWNKLCGWSYGMHHTNSIRVCWRPIFGSESNNGVISDVAKIELCIYVYENSIRKISQKTLLVEVEKDFDIKLEHHVQQNQIALYKNCCPIYLHDYNTKPTWGYNLYPFFGGNLPSPHNMIIKLEKL